MVAVRRAGQFVGEMAAFASAAQRCASVVARGPVRALVVPGEALRACVERVPEARPASGHQSVRVRVACSDLVVPGEALRACVERVPEARPASGHQSVEFRVEETCSALVVRASAACVH